MDMLLLPGYKTLFGTPEVTYEELVKDIPSDIVIAVMIMLSNELDAPIPHRENQQRLRDIVAHRYTNQQRQHLTNAFVRFRKSVNGNYNNTVFAKPSLLAMILKELNNYRDFKVEDTSYQHEYNILLAYFLVVDEVNDYQQNLLQAQEAHMEEPFFDYRILWTPNISQYEYNDFGDVGFELFKLLCFSKYCLKNYRSYFKEYIISRGFKNVSQMLKGISDVIHATLYYNKEKVLSKLTYIQPEKGVDDRYLKMQAINTAIGKPLLRSSFKIHPLFYDKRHGYMIIDAAFYKKKTYTGPFFELLNQTNLKKHISFNSYSREISSNVLEKLCFTGIVKSIVRSEGDFVHFDDGSDDVPDGYYRNTHSILLLEFKGYLFPAELSDNPSFERIKKYIDERFIESEGGKAKGISQLVRQIDILLQSGFDFDEKYKTDRHRDLTVYPIICHNEFHFTMPGVNEYLNIRFQEKLKDKKIERITIKPLLVTNLAALFDLISRKKGFNDLIHCIDRYYAIIEGNKKMFRKTLSPNDFLLSNSSFDEIYDSVFQKEFIKATDEHRSITELASQINLTLEELEEEL